MKLLGKIEKVNDLRTIWPHEARNFSKWLAQEENLKQLGDAIGVSIVLEECESSVGEFNVDLYATEEGTNRKIIIENQLADTNHDHLGKIITYASGKDAEVIVWIVKRARDEHKQAIAWLNQHTDENIGFFLVEIELWKIDDSRPAVRFNIVERPNDWAKTMKASEGLSDIKKLQLEFWQAFTEYAFAKADFGKIFSPRKAAPQHWYNLSVGNSSFHLGLTVNTQKHRIGAEIYIPDDKGIYSKFLERKAEIESALGRKLDWIEAEKACRILVTRSGDICNENENWQTFFDWLCDRSVKLRDIALRYGK